MSINITDSELEIMKILWIRPLKLKDICKKFSKSSSTTKTLIYRLKNKQIICKQNNLYYSKITEQHYLQQETIRHIKKYYNGDVSKFIQNIDTKKISKEVVDNFITLFNNAYFSATNLNLNFFLVHHKILFHFLNS